MLKNSQLNEDNPPSAPASASRSSSPCPRTDLACESPGAVNSDAAGTKVQNRQISGIQISCLEVLSEAGEAATGRRRGTYVTLYCPLMKYMDCEESENITEALAAMLREMTEKLCGAPVGRSTRVLVAGLGNRFITADALGPRTADKLAVTGHMMESGLLDAIGCSSLCAVHPGVMGQTGIEAFAMIKGAAEYARPDVVIAVDALAARSTRRLASTIQLSDTGIEPGSGIGNRRGAVNRESIGCPVIALGVPTVVDSATLVGDALEKAGCDDMGRLREVLEQEKSFFVSPKDGDVICDEVSSVLAAAINRAFQTEGL